MVQTVKCKPALPLSLVLQNCCTISPFDNVENEETCCQSKHCRSDGEIVKRCLWCTYGRVCSLLMQLCCFECQSAATCRGVIFAHRCYAHSVRKLNMWDVTPVRLPPRLWATQMDQHMSLDLCVPFQKIRH